MMPGRVRRRRLYRRVHAVPRAGGTVRGRLDDRHLLTSGGFFADPVLELGTDAQKERWLRPLTTDDPPMTALAVTEPDLGSESAAITTKARRVGSGYKLSGQKTWISNGGVADFYIFFATIDSTVGPAV